MADTPNHPPMTFREAVKQDRAYSRVRPCTEREYAEWDRASAIVDAGTAFIEARAEVVRVEGVFPYNGKNVAKAFEAQRKLEETLRALERGESEGQP